MEDPLLLPTGAGHMPVWRCKGPAVQPMPVNLYRDVVVVGPFQGSSVPIGLLLLSFHNYLLPGSLDVCLYPCVSVRGTLWLWLCGHTGDGSWHARVGALLPGWVFLWLSSCVP